METASFLEDLENFLQNQRVKLNADKKKLENSNPTSPVIFPEVSDLQSKTLQSERRPTFQTNTCQTDISIPQNVVKSPLPTRFPEDEYSNFYEMINHPKYGLPGLGEFNDQHKILLKEQKKELNNILSQAIRAKYERNSRSAPVDYDELLARKRDEELKYRQLNQFEPTNLRGTYSDGFLNQNFYPTSDLAFQRIRPPEVPSNFIRNEVDDLNDLLSRLQRYTEREYSDTVPVASHSEIDQEPKFNSPNDFARAYSNRSLQMNSILTPEREKPRFLPPNPNIGVVPQERERRIHEEKQKLELYRRELEEQMQEQRERRKRILAEEREDIISHAVPSYVSGRSQNGNNNSYQSDLLKQIEETRLRKQLEKEQQMKWEKKIDDGKQSPWRQTESVHGSDGVRNVPNKWHDGRWPLPENKPEKPKLNYQEELRLQIEEKKRREKLEKENQRREEEKLAERLEQQRQKIQAEFEAEQKRQNLKEAEARRKAELAHQKQKDDQRETERKKKSREGLEWWEKENEVRVNRKSPNLQVYRSPSPPLPSVQNEARGIIVSPPLIQSPKPNPRITKPGTPKQSKNEIEKFQIEKAEIKRKKSSHLETKVDPKESRLHSSSFHDSSPRGGVLGQLSAMRRKLQSEQQRIQKEMEKNDDYEVFDPRLKNKQRDDKISAGRRRDSNDSLSVNDIAIKNRERQAKLNKWQTSERE